MKTLLAAIPAILMLSLPFAASASPSARSFHCVNMAHSAIEFDLYLTPAIAKVTMTTLPKDGIAGQLANPSITMNYETTEYQFARYENYSSPTMNSHMHQSVEVRFKASEIQNRDLRVIFSVSAPTYSDTPGSQMIGPYEMMCKSK